MKNIKSVCLILTAAGMLTGCGVADDGLEDIRVTNSCISEELSTTYEATRLAIVEEQTTTTTTTPTTTTTTTTIAITTTMPVTEPSTEMEPETELVQPIETEPEVTLDVIEEPIEVTDDTPDIISDVYPVTDYERELLAQVVEHEAGSDWIGCYDKAKCVAVIMNRIRQGCWGGTDVYSVLTAKGQFPGFYPGWCEAREGAYEAVDYYFEHPDEFSTTITGWTGDGYQNYFT